MTRPKPSPCDWPVAVVSMDWPAWRKSSGWKTAAGRLLLLRPLLEADPADICSDLPHADDPSNDDVRFERVRWRRHMPQMSEAGLSPVGIGRICA